MMDPRYAAIAEELRLDALALVAQAEEWRATKEAERGRTWAYINATLQECRCRLEAVGRRECAMALLIFGERDE